MVMIFNIIRTNYTFIKIRVSYKLLYEYIIYKYFNIFNYIIQKTTLFIHIYIHTNTH